MRSVHVEVTSHLRVDANLLGVDIVDEILDELTLENPERVEAERRQQYGWEDLPEEWLLAELDGDVLVMPRGYAFQLKLLLRENGLRVKWVDRRVWERGTPFGKDEFSYRPHQPAAVRAMRHHQQGIYKAPTGSGKTVTACGLMWETHPRHALILVDRINLVTQWIDRIHEHTGIPREQIGRIGAGKWTEGRITVATVQTLFSRIAELREMGWFKKHSIVFLDECHHVTAVTIDTLMQEFHARMRLGTSATPDKTGNFEIALNVLGEVFYETTHDELRELGILLEPEVDVVHTRFTFDYWGDHKASKKGHCKKPGCKNREPYHRHRNNYAALKSALVNDPERNALIAEQVVKYQDRVQLVITDQTSHIDALEQSIIHTLLGQEIYILTGKQTGKKRDEIIKQIEEREEPCVILSTIAGEALDIPIISVTHLPWPTRNPRKTEQNVGRATRTHDLKDGAIVVDYVDPHVDILVGQFRTRRWQCYEPLGFTVNTPDDEDTQPRRKKGLTRLGGAS